MPEIQIAQFLSNEVRSLRNRLALRIDARLVQETPKDTTEAASAWLISVGSPDNSESTMQNPAAAISNGAAKINAAPTYTKLYIQNTKPYIDRLNNGWSLQAPSKYIDRIIAQEVAREQ
jgi:hypothetical protein